MFADFLTVIPQTRSMVLITYRPEYRGSLAHVSGAQTISLAPLTESESAELLDELLGAGPSVAAIAALIAERAAGNPFFVQEIVREFAERGVLEGHRGEYTCRTDISEVAVPVTVQAAIAARIDRLDAESKQTLNAAAVIGSHFTPELVTALGIDPVVDELARVELIDQVRFTPSSEYAFRHPLIRTVAYESQLKSDRAQLHRRLAAAIEQHDPGSADENAALIAEHLEAAGDLHAAYGWHMRAATWATNRDLAAARLGWERARTIADALPAEDSNRAAMRIVPRTMLCAIAFRYHIDVSGDIFDELRELCTAAEDKASLVLAMAGLVVDHAYHARIHEASQLASEAWALAESVGDPSLTVCLSTAAILSKAENSEFSDVLRWTQRAIDLADGDPSIGNVMVGSPLALAIAQRGNARFWLGLPGWRDDQRQGLTMARSADALSYAAAASFVYIPGIPGGALRADDRAVREIEEALRIAERSGDDLAMVLGWMALGLALVHRPTDPERDRGQKFLAEACDWISHWRYLLCELPVVKVYLARERARCGDRDQAIPLMHAAVDELFRDRQSLWSVPATGVLVETLLDRGTESDVAQAEATIERLAAVPADEGLAVRDIWLLRLRALLARAHGDAATYAHLRDRYRDMATSLGFEGHIAWAEALP